MPRTNFKLTELEIRKQLLLVESEVNRHQFVAEVTALRRDLEQLGRNASSLMGTASSLFAGFQFVRDLWGKSHAGKNGEDGEENPASSWASKISSAIRAGTDFWNRFKNKDQAEE